jgi:hypothetical protein
MERWNIVLRESEENYEVDNFLKEIVKVCEKYNFSIGHEDNHGSFIIHT